MTIRSFPRIFGSSESSPSGLSGNISLIRPSRSDRCGLLVPTEQPPFLVDLRLSCGRCRGGGEDGLVSVSGRHLVETRMRGYERGLGERGVIREIWEMIES
jgi:hypothetical protein